MKSDSVDYQQVIQNHNYRFQFFELIEQINENNFKEIAQNVTQLIEPKPKQRIPLMFRALISIIDKRGRDFLIFKDFILELFGSNDNPRFPKHHNYLSYKIFHLCHHSRSFCYIVGLLLSTGLISPERIEVSLRSLFKFFLIDHPTFYFALYALSIMIPSHEYLKECFPTTHTWVCNMLSTLLSYFASPQAASCLNEFTLFFHNQKIVPNKYYQIFLNDDVEMLSKEEINPKAEYYTSIFDHTEVLLYCPSLASAAAYFHANKCLEHLINIGVDLHHCDLKKRGFPYFSGSQGNFVAFSLMNPNQDQIKEYIRALIKFWKLNKYDEIPYEGLFPGKESILHIAALYNNFRIVQQVINAGFDVNIADECDDLPQHLAARVESTEAILILSTHPQFNINVPNISDHTCIKLAMNNQHEDLMNLLFYDMKAEFSSLQYFAVGIGKRSFTKSFYRLTANQRDEEPEEDESDSDYDEIYDYDY